MKYLLLLPGSMAIALSNPYSSSKLESLGAPLPWSFVGFRALEARKWFRFLILLVLCIMIGFGFHVLELPFIPFLLAFWHISAAFSGTSSQRHLIHSALATSFFLSQFPITSAFFQLGVIHLLIGSILVFLKLSPSRPPAWAKARTLWGLFPLSAALWILPIGPKEVGLGAILLGLTFWSSQSLGRSLALKH
jgi:hypothetical protein